MLKFHLAYDKRDKKISAIYREKNIMWLNAYPVVYPVVFLQSQQIICTVSERAVLRFSAL